MRQHSHEWWCRKNGTVREQCEKQKRDSGRCSNSEDINNNAHI